MVSVVIKGYFVGYCGFESRRCYCKVAALQSLFACCLTTIIHDSVSVGYSVSTQGRNSAAVLCGKAIRFDSGADTPHQAHTVLCSCKNIKMPFTKRYFARLNSLG